MTIFKAELFNSEKTLLWTVETSDMALASALSSKIVAQAGKGEFIRIFVNGKLHYTMTFECDASELPDMPEGGYHGSKN